MNFLVLFLQSGIGKKPQEAPDNGYAIGVWIGHLLPL